MATTDDHEGMGAEVPLAAGLGPVPPAVPGLRIGDFLGAGSRGSVWAGVREADGLAVAVKVVPCADTESAEHAGREVAVLGSLNIEGLVRFHEVIGLPVHPPAIAIVLDRVEGGSLERAVRARGHLSLGESVTVLTPVARTLADLHAAGVVHADLSPANVLLERTGRPLVADLGLARLPPAEPLWGPDADPTDWGSPARQSGAGHPGGGWGTDGFAAPEVVAGGPPTAASDVYALGALAWFCITGEPPGPGTVRRPLDELAPGLPTGWRETTLRALSADPSRRPSASEAAVAYFDAAAATPLRLVLGGDATSLLTHRLRQDAVAAGTPPTRRDRRREGRRRRQGRWRSPWQGTVGRLVMGRLLVGAVVVGAVVAGAVVVVGGWDAVPRAGGSGPGPARDSGATSVAQRPGGRPDLATDPRGPTRDPVGVMQALADTRSAAMNAADPGLLLRLDAPSSPALARDTADLAAVVAGGERYAGVGLHVRWARATEVTSAQVTVEAVVDSAAYRLVGSAGAREHAATQGRPLRFVLAWWQGRWRVVRVEPIS